MGEDRRYSHGFLMRQAVDQPRHVFLVKTKSVHTRIDLNMNRHILQTLRLRRRNNSLERLVRIDIRF